MVRRNSRRLLNFEPPRREAMGALSQDERHQVRSALATGEEVLATVRAWFGEHRRAWALTTRRVLVLNENALLGAFPLDDVSRLDCEPCGVGTALWLYTSHELVELHLANPDDAETFACEFENLHRDAMVLRIVN